MRIKIEVDDVPGQHESHYISVLDSKLEIISSLSLEPLNECPEDAILGRGIPTADEIFRLMKLAYDAGKRGEEFVAEMESKNE